MDPQLINMNLQKVMVIEVYNRVIHKVRRHNTKTLSLVINKVKNIRREGGGGTKKMINFCGKLSFTLSFLFP